MLLTNNQIEEVAFIFERENGHPGDDYTREVLSESKLVGYEVNELEKIIVEGLNEGIYKDSDSRTSAYWALSKRHKYDLIPSFKNWLKSELLEENSNAIYQLLIALGNLDEPVFNKDREGGSAIYETELNLRDAQEYLKNEMN